MQTLQPCVVFRFGQGHQESEIQNHSVKPVLLKSLQVWPNSRFSAQNKREVKTLMVFTSRGGVGCCWVNSLLRLADQDNLSLGSL